MTLWLCHITNVTIGSSPELLIVSRYQTAYHHNSDRQRSATIPSFHVVLLVSSLSSAPPTPYVDHLVVFMLQGGYQSVPMFSTVCVVERARLDENLDYLEGGGLVRGHLQSALRCHIGLQPRRVWAPPLSSVCTAPRAHLPSYTRRAVHYRTVCVAPGIDVCAPLWWTVTPRNFVLGEQVLADWLFRMRDYVFSCARHACIC
jgi:hypothetical protein